MAISTLIYQTIAGITPLDEISMDAARSRQDTLTKPLGSLGRLEALSIQLAGIFANPIPEIRRKCVMIAAGDHGVVAEGVSAYPQEVTPQMVLNFLSGGAAINVLARHVSSEIVVIDAGVAADLEPHPLLTSEKIGKGTNNFAVGPAMTNQQAIQCLEVGIKAATREIGLGTDLIACGEMGIGNTTSSSAITAVITGSDPNVTTGRGTGLEDEGLANKVDVIKRGIKLNNADPSNGLDVLTKLGGFEIGVLSGIMLGAAANHKPVLVDGFISGAAALIAWRLSPLVVDYFISAHRSVEPGHSVGLESMGISPLLTMDMRLGEGTGAALAMPIVEAAVKCLSQMATFEQAGVSERNEDDDEVSN